MDYYDDTYTPRPDRHGVCSHPIDSTNLVSPYGDDHGDSPFPQNSSGDVEPKADRHDGQMSMHPGTPKPGSFKD